jgi:hypothetical protein
MKQQALLLDDAPDKRFEQFPLSVQQAALELMTALILHVHILPEQHDHESSTDRQ